MTSSHIAYSAAAEPSAAWQLSANCRVSITAACNLVHRLMCGRLVEARVATAPHQGDEATSLLLDLTERLLDAHAAALAASAGAPSAVRAQLQTAYEEQRQELLQAALDEAVRLRAAGELVPRRVTVCLNARSCSSRKGTCCGA